MTKIDPSKMLIVPASDVMSLAPTDPITKAEVVALAEEASRHSQRCMNLGMMNTPRDATKRVEQAAEYQIAQDMHAKAQADYRQAFNRWAAVGYPEDVKP